MIRALFIGGCEHSRVMEVPGGCIKGPERHYLDIPAPMDPWDHEELARIAKGETAKPIRARTHIYRAHAMSLGPWQRAWVYVLQGIEFKQVEQVYLLEPGMAEKLRRIAF